MKKPSAKIRDEISRLQDQLRLAETREAERIGRLAIKAGLGELEVEDGELIVAFEQLVIAFRDPAKREASAAKNNPGPPQGTQSEA